MNIDNPTLTAESFARTVEHEGFRFDFSLQSLQFEIDRYLEKYGTVRGETSHKIECDLTAYIGETLKRIYKGEWVGQYYNKWPECGNNFYTCKIEIGKFEFYPSHFISYYLCNGKITEGTFYEYLYKGDSSKGTSQDISDGGLINNIETQK